MKPRVLLWVAICCLPMLVGCAAALVPATNDPAKKLAWAQELIDNQGRALPAEGLINEALVGYESKGDELGSAEAYRVYGIFFKSSAVERSAGHYRKHGFIDKSATYDNRFEKAEEYFLKSRAILQKNKDLDSLPNVYLLLGMTNQLMGRTDVACAAYEKSLEVYQTRKLQEPQAMTVLPKQYSSYEEGIADFKRRAGCKL